MEGSESLMRLEYHDNKITNPQKIYPKPYSSKVKNHLKTRIPENAILASQLAEITMIDLQVFMGYNFEEKLNNLTFHDVTNLVLGIRVTIDLYIHEL
jgi:hypothetical protein